MTKTHGKNAVFKLDNSGGALQDLSTYIDTTELQRAVENADVTAFGDGWDKSVPGVKSAKIPIGGPSDPVLDAHMDAVFGQDATLTFEFGPEGSAVGKVRYTGECRIEDYAVKSPVKGRNEWSAGLVLDGALTRNTF